MSIRAQKKIKMAHQELGSSKNIPMIRTTRFLNLAESAGTAADKEVHIINNRTLNKIGGLIFGVVQLIVLSSKSDNVFFISR